MSLVYLDTSVALAHLMSEDRRPPASLWSRSLVASRLLEYELFVRLNASGLGDSHGSLAATLLSEVALVELTPPVLARAREPFPVVVRTLDALHLASADFLRSQGHAVELASYDERMCTAAAAMAIPLVLL